MQNAISGIYPLPLLLIYLLCCLGCQSDNDSFFPEPNLTNLAQFDTIRLSNGENFAIIDIEDNRCPCYALCDQTYDGTVEVVLTSDLQDTVKLRFNPTIMDTEGGLLRTAQGGTISFVRYDHESFCTGNVPPRLFTLGFLVAP